MIPIEMFSGTTVNLLDPDPETIRLDDIAHHIARIHRYTGGTEWSVAAHSLCVAMLVPPEFKLEALLHDAHEAYVGDVSAPVKAAMRELVVIEQYEGSVFDLIEEDFERVVREKFRLPDEKSEEVHRADMVMRATERQVFLRNSPKAWEGLPEPAADEFAREHMRHVWHMSVPLGIELLVESRWLAEVDAEMRKRDPAWGTTTMLESKPRWP